MTSFILKLIALVTMFCDHFGYILMGHISFFNIIGRIAFPIFAFQISEGYIHTKSIKKYFIRLLAFACISQIPYYLFLQKIGNNPTHELNIFFTLILGLACIMIYDYFSKKDINQAHKTFLGLNVYHYLGLLCVLFIAILGEALKVDYGFWGVTVIFSFYLFKNHKIAMILSYIILCILKYGSWSILYGFHSTYLYNCIATILPIIFISLYNRKQGKKIKYLLYIFYPLHLLLLYLIP